MYQRPFRIVQDIAVDASPDGVRALNERESLTVTGTLNYQACDEKMCFNPESVALTWTVHLKPVDRERTNKE